MAEFSIVAENGKTLNLLSNPYFVVIDIDGQTGFNNSISSYSGVYDGAGVSNVRTEPRQIDITLHIINGVNVESAKRYIFDVIKPKKYHKIIWTQDKRTLVINGLCESAEMPRWQNGILCKISFFCRQPYWEDIENAIQEISATIGLHYFTNDNKDMLYFDYYSNGNALSEYNVTRTKDFYNSGDVAVGMRIEIMALDTVTNPVIYSAYDKYIGVNGVTLSAGESIVITTGKGEKDIQKDGVSIIDKIREGSTWLQLETGENTFNIDSDDTSNNNMYFNIIYKQRYA